MDQLLALLHQHIGSIGPDCDVIAQNMRAAQTIPADILAAIEARVRAAEVREEYRQYSDDARRDLPPIEQENLGLPTFREWKEANGHA